MCSIAAEFAVHTVSRCITACQADTLLFVQESVEDTFAALVRARRKELGLSQRQLADRLFEQRGLRLDPTAITRIEQPGKRALRLSEAAALATVLNIDLNALIATWGDPRSRLDRSQRLIADWGHDAREALKQMVLSAMDAREILEDSPELVTVLHPTLPPKSPNGYFRWLGMWLSARVSRDVVVEVDDVSARRALQGLVEELCRDLVVAPRETDGSDGAS